MDAPALAVPWFESPFFEEELESSQLAEATRAQVRRYAEDGYLVFRPEIEDFDVLAERIINSLAPEHVLAGNRVLDAWRYQPDVRNLASHPSIMAVLRALYLRRPIPFQTLNFREGSQQRTHSDLVHFNSVPARFMAGVWIALEDVGPDNGPLHYYPGSHKLRVYELHDIGLASAKLSDRNERYAGYEEFVGRLVAQHGLRKEVVSVKRGEALIWAANLFHGGEPIRRAGSTRHTQVTHYYFEGCRYYTPIYSDPAVGRFAWKRVIDVTSDRPVEHMYGGRPVALPLRQRLRYVAEDRVNRSKLGRQLYRRVKARLSGT
ncbi:MAG: hypothetical protein QOE35_2 [Actinomycetota bacterium]|jgi:hypothetical protein